MQTEDLPPPPDTRVDSQGRCYKLLPAKHFAFGRENHVAEIAAPLYIAQLPVCRAEFLDFLAKSGHEYDSASRELMDLIAPHPMCPATPVSWNDAKCYIRWMRRVTGEYYSLPQDREWEYAARGQYGAPYPWGTVLPTPALAHFSPPETPCYQTTRVDARPDGKSPFGCLDMVGNAWEWTLDTYEDENVIHGLRGGSCMDCIDTVRCTARRFEIDHLARVPYASIRMVYLPGEMLPAYRSAVASNDYGEKTQIIDMTPEFAINPLKGSSARKYQ